MARARNIKPSFFMNDALVELSFECRLLFIGLWTLADRDGKLEDRPKRIKMEIFPADNIDIDQALTDLEGAGFIDRYEANGLKVLLVTNFTKHQRPHHTEKASELPDKDGCLTVKTPLSNEEDQEQDGEYPPDTGYLIPDTGYRNGEEDTSGKPAEPPPPKNDTCPHQEIIDLYHKHLPSSRKVRCWTDKRRGLLRARWREDVKRQNLEWWSSFFEYIDKSDFLMGRTHSVGRASFEISLDWIVGSENMAKIIEGKYEEAEKS